MEDFRKSKSLKSVLGDFKKSDFSSLRNFFHSSFFGWIIFSALVVGISLILSFHVDYLPADIKVGKIASKDIKSDQNYDIVDLEPTRANQQAAFESVPEVYDYNEAVAGEIDLKIQNTFAAARQAFLENAEPAKILGLLHQGLGIDLLPVELKTLSEDRFSQETEKALRGLVGRAMAEQIVANRSVLPTQEKKAITLRNIQKSGPSNETVITDLAEIKTLEQVKENISQPSFKLPETTGLGIPQDLLKKMAGQLLSPNVSFNSVDTEFRRARAMSNVPDVVIKVQAGEAIIRSGDRYEPYHLIILEGIRRQKTQANFTAKVLGTVLYVFLLLLITYAFSRRFVRKFNPTRQDLYFLGGALVLVLLVVRLSAALSSGLRDLFPYDVSVQALYFAIPVAGGAMLTRYILNAEIALVFAIVTSALAGIFLQGDLGLSIYFLISGIVAASAIAHSERRSSILRAGLIVGFFNALVIAAMKLITLGNVTEALSIPSVLLTAGLGFLGGILASIFVMVLAPIAELIFDYVTDIKLLELGNLNHPLLREMIVQAPGTYHHSQLVAVLAEAAAAEVRANPLLARVGSYFHDIGKMRKPSYFIENQQGGENRHDKLSPSMSALIIASHVKDGLELARDYKLPSRIADIIPQHQGTKLITFFYKKALERSEEGDSPVDEKHYRYPGPRPQTREAGIILLADGVEAAVRSMAEKTPQKIRAKALQIINKNFTEEQLDECDLTLKDLHAIAETFTRVLIGIYHQRIEYPEEEEKQATVTPIKGRL